MSPSPSLRRHHRDWLSEVDRCIELARRPESCARRADGVSAWSVGEQLEHLLKANTGILRAIDKLCATPPEEGETGSPSLVGRVVLLAGVFPRGRAKAPERTRPEGMAPDGLAQGFDRVRQDVEALEGRLEEIERVPCTGAHPVLGHFTPAQWVRFSVVHNRHHGKIIRDILRAS